MRQDLESMGLEVHTMPERILEINESLEALDEDDQQLATIVKLRVSFGMTTEEIAALLEVSRIDHAEGKSSVNVIRR